MAPLILFKLFVHSELSVERISVCNAIEKNVETLHIEKITSQTD